MENASTASGCCGDDNAARSDVAACVFDGFPGATAPTRVGSQATYRLSDHKSTVVAREKREDSTNDQTQQNSIRSHGRSKQPGGSRQPCSVYRDTHTCTLRFGYIHSELPPGKHRATRISCV